MAAGLLWASALSVFWTYLGFPAVTLVRAVVRPRPYTAGDGRPSVSIVIAAHNEERAIGDKLANLLALDYDPALLDVVVVTDGCTDGTDDVVRRFGGRVRLLSLGRVGKARALNEAVATCTAEVLVFSDANSMLARDAVAEIVRPFSDPEVGGVAGDQRYSPQVQGEAAGSGERSYWSLDRALKRAESRSGHVISATGALYAVRRALFQPVVEGVTDDFIISTGVISQGSRLVFAPAAHVYEDVSSSESVEFGRKVRIMTRGLRGVAVRRDLLDPRRHGYYSLQLLTHKVLRRMMVVPLATAYVTTVALSRRSRSHRLAALAQTGLYAAGSAGLLLGRRGKHSKLLDVPAYFLMVNAASAKALWNLASGRRIDRWTPQRR